MPPSDSESDEEDHPVRQPPPLETFPPAGDAQLTVEGAALLKGVLTKKESGAARKALQLLRDAAGISYVFSSPKCARAPPCGNESLWLDDDALDAYDTDAGDALRKAVDKCREAVAKAAGCAVERASLPMASVGPKPSLTERFHCGTDGMPGGAAASQEQEQAQPLLLTAVLYLDEGGPAAWVMPPPTATAEADAAKPAKRARKQPPPPAAAAAGVSFQPGAGQAHAAIRSRPPAADTRASSARSQPCARAY